jgi:hypothetical protein
MPSAVCWYANCIEFVSAGNLTAFFGYIMSQADAIPCKNSRTLANVCRVWHGIAALI